MGTDTICASPFLLLCYILDTSFRLTNQHRTILSEPNLLPPPASSSHCGACLSMSRRSSSQRSLVLLQPHSFLRLLKLMFCCPFLPIGPSGLLLKHIFTPCGQITLTSTATCPSNGKWCQCGHFMPKAQVSHKTVPAGPPTCLHLSTSRICYAFCCASLHLPNPDPFRPSKRGHSGKFFLDFQLCSFP